MYVSCVQYSRARIPDGTSMQGFDVPVLCAATADVLRSGLHVQVSRVRRQISQCVSSHEKRGLGLTRRPRAAVVARALSPDCQAQPRPSHRGRSAGAAWGLLMVGTGSVSARRAPLACDRRVVAPHARQPGRAIDPAHRAQAPLDTRPGCLRGAGLLGSAAPAAMCHKLKPRPG